MITVLNPSQLKSNAGKVLDAAIKRPQYINRNGVILVLQKANLVPAPSDDAVSSPWEVRAATLESFYDPAKAW